MAGIKKYDIGIAKLSNKTHRFEFELDDQFFALFEQSFITHGKLNAIVDLDKNERLLTLHFTISGEIQLTCDRSLEEFMFPVNISENLLVKYGEEARELSEDMLQITPDTQTLNVAQHLYDYIGLAVPMKKLHPRYQAEEDDSTDENLLIFSTSTDRGMIDDDDEPDENQTDPRWDALRNISDN